MNKLIWLLLLAELILLSSVVILEFTRYNYFAISRLKRVVERIFLHTPILFLVVLAPESNFKWMMFISFCLMFIAEMFIIFDFLNGFIANFIFNIFNIVMFSIMNQAFSFSVAAVTFGAGALIYLFIFLKKIKGVYAVALPLYLLVQLTMITRAVNINEAALIGCISITLCDIEIGYTEFIKKFPLYQQINFILWFAGMTFLYVSLHF